MSVFFIRYHPVSKKRTWFVTQIQIMTKKSSTYTQGDYSGLLSLRHKHLYPSVPPFWEKIADVRISWKKFILLSQRRMWLVTQIHVITKKSSTYTQGDYSGLSYDINIYNPEFHRFEKKLLMSVFFIRYHPVSKKRTWFVTQIQIMTKKSSTYTQGDYSGLL